MATAVSADGKYEEAAQREYLAWLKQHRPDSPELMLLGSTGMGTLFGVRSRCKIVESVIGEFTAPIILNITARADDDIDELIAHGNDTVRDGDTIAIMPDQFYGGIPEEGLYGFLSRCLQQIRGGIKKGVYNFPQNCSGAGLTANLVRRLAEAGLLDRIKDSSHQIADMVTIKTEADKHGVEFLSGNDDLSLSVVQRKLGTRRVTGLSQTALDLFRRILLDFEPGGDNSASNEHQSKIIRLCNLPGELGAQEVSVVHALLSHLCGFPEGRKNAIEPLSEEQKRRAVEVLKEVTG